AAGLGLAAGTATAQAPIKRVGGTRLKTSLNAFSFNKLLNDHLRGRGKGMILFDLLEYCAEQNFDAIDPTGYFFPGYPNPPSDSYLSEFKRQAHELCRACSGRGAGSALPWLCTGARAKDVQHIKEWVEVAARMAAPVL